jgi:hypothetical protein
MSETPHEDYNPDLDDLDDDITGYENDEDAEGDFATEASEEDFEDSNENVGGEG